MAIVLNKPKAIHTASAANGGGAVITLPPVQDVVENELKQLADSIRQRMVRSIVETGRDLQKAKAKLPHGQFGNWLKTEFDMSPKTAENYMRAAELADTKNEIVSFLPAAVLYKLAAPSTPAAVQIKVIADLEAGKKPTMGEVEGAIQSAKLAKALEKEAAEKSSDKLAGKSPEEVAKIKKNKDIHDAKITAAKAESAEVLDQQQVALTNAAAEAMEFLRANLGDDRFKLFVALYSKTDAVKFSEALTLKEP